MDVRSLTIGDLNRIARERGQRGKVATAQGLIDHTQASLKGRSGTPNQTWRQFRAPTEEQMRAELSVGLPDVVRRSARERYRVLVRMLFDEGQRSYEMFGYPVWPKSIQAELKALGWKEGNPNLEGQVEALARKYIEEGARIQKAKDDRKVALDWSGHYSA